MPTKPRVRFAGYVALFVAGAVLGAFWDQLHVQSGTIVYAEPTFGGQPWWVPLEFGAAFVAMGLLFTYAGDLAPRPASPKVAGVELAWITGVYAATAFFDRWPWPLLVVLAVLLAVRAGALVDIAMSSPLPVLAVVVGGPLFEAGLVGAGAYEYRTSELGPIPIWLPLLWANGVVFAARATEAAMQRFGRRRIAEPATAHVLSEEPAPPTPPQQFAPDDDGAGDVR